MLKQFLQIHPLMKFWILQISDKLVMSTSALASLAGMPSNPAPINLNLGSVMTKSKPLQPKSKNQLTSELSRSYVPRQNYLIQDDVDALLRKFHIAVKSGDHDHIQSVLATPPIPSNIPAHLEDPTKCQKPYLLDLKASQYHILVGLENM